MSRTNSLGGWSPAGDIRSVKQWDKNGLEHLKEVDSVQRYSEGQ